MGISETANKNHEELFPNHKSTLKITDPELIEVFDNFAFDEVLSYGNLDARTRLMVISGSMIASQALGEYHCNSLIIFLFPFFDFHPSFISCAVYHRRSFERML